MIRIDTAKIYAPVDILQSFNEHAFITQQNKRTDTDKVLQQKHVSEHTGIAGLKRISVDENNVIIELSAKILKNDYYELLNKNTIEQAIDMINISNIVSVDKSRINEFKVHSADFTQNIKSDYTPQQIIDTCRLVNSTKHIVETYKGHKDNRHKTGIVFRGIQKSFRERLIIYDKHAELLKDKSFLKHIDKQLLFVSKFTGVTRCEMNITEHRKLREYCNTDNVLIDILQSKETPLFKLYKKVIADNFIQTSLFDCTDVPLYKIEKRLGRETICKQLNYDIALIKSFISKYVSGNISKYLREYKNIIADIQPSNVEQCEQQKIITELEYQLKTA